ncbi:hypothetical protein CDCA_CDCA01G0351 [Cyanidium caldarium]|uniref:Uncharacterized protein n=1 Tax=Cyanidium caldarium TaxID=2771 RepID=A0AAV9IQH8_CYACA|nr:hypothetical protein CDCA_CDCA01G0351 [Cyanidium caldarium]
MPSGAGREPEASEGGAGPAESAAPPPRAAAAAATSTTTPYAVAVTGTTTTAATPETGGRVSPARHALLPCMYCRQMLMYQLGCAWIMCPRCQCVINLRPAVSVMETGGMAECAQCGVVQTFPVGTRQATCEQCAAPIDAPAPEHVACAGCGTCLAYQAGPASRIFCTVCRCVMTLDGEPPPPPPGPSTAAAAATAGSLGMEAAAATATPYFPVPPPLPQASLMAPPLPPPPSMGWPAAAAPPGAEGALRGYRGRAPRRRTGGGGGGGGHSGGGHERSEMVRARTGTFSSPAPSAAIGHERPPALYPAEALRPPEPGGPASATAESTITATPETGAATTRSEQLPPPPPPPPPPER